MYYKRLDRIQYSQRIVSCKYDKNRFLQRSQCRMKDSLMDHKLNNQNILSYKCYKFHHQQSIHLRMKKQG